MPDDRNDNNSQAPRDPKIPGMPGGKKPTRTGWLYFLLACALLGYAFFNMGSGFANSSNTVKLATSEMVSAIKQDRVEDLTYTVQDGSVTGHYWKTKKDKGDTSELKSFSSTYVGSDSLAELMAEHPDTKYIVNTNDPDFWGDLAMSVLPTIALIAIMFYFMRQMMGANNRNMQFGKTNAKTNEATRPKVKFEDVAGVDEAVEELKAAGAKKAVILPVSAPFHSTLMKPAAEKLADELAKVTIHDAAFPVVSNYTGELETKAEEIKANLVAQADHPVRWITCVKTMQAFGADTFVEAGPGKTLCGFNRRIDRSIKSLNVENLESLQKTLDYLKEVR